MQLHQQIVQAVKTRNTNEIASLMDEGADPHYHEPGMHSPFQIAYAKNDLECALAFAQHKKFKLPPNYKVAIYLSVQNGMPQLTKALLDQAQKENIEDNGLNTFISKATQHTSLIIATIKGNAPLVKLLLQYGASPYILNHNNESALTIAMTNGNDDIIDAMLASEAPVDENGIIRAIHRAHDINNPVLERTIHLKAGVDTTLKALKSMMDDENQTHYDNQYKYTDSLQPEVATPLAHDESNRIKMIGRGGFAEVYQYNHNGTEIALKKASITAALLPLVTLERNMLHYTTKYRLPNVVQYIGHSISYNTKDITYCLFMEYLPTSLSSAITSRSLTSQTIKAMIIHGIIVAVDGLHEHGIMHRDIKSDNVLLDNKLKPRLCDFGFAMFGRYSSAIAGTTPWQAPEVRKGRSGLPSDIYSLATTIWEIIAENCNPFEQDDEQTVIRKIDNGERETLPPNTAPGLAHLVTLGWMGDPAERPTASQMLSEFPAELLDEKKCTR